MASTWTGDTRRPVAVSVFFRSLRRWQTLTGVDREAAAVMVAGWVRDPDVAFVTVDDTP